MSRLPSAGYWRNPEATAKTIRDGWLWTGDLGSLDADGFLTLKDRSKDVIISGGSNIYPREVEEVLLKHPAVREVSVVGRADPDWGEVVVAFVVGSGADAADRIEPMIRSGARWLRPPLIVSTELPPPKRINHVSIRLSSLEATGQAR